MTNITFFLVFIPILAIILLLINFLLAPHLPDKNKDAQFECGFSSFTQMSRLPFSISFFIYALLFLLFDLEILLVYPYVVSAYNNTIYGLVVMLVFFILLTIGFIFELGKKALYIDSRQSYTYEHKIFNFHYRITNIPSWFLRFSTKVTYRITYIPNLITCFYIKYPCAFNIIFSLILLIIINCYNSAYIYCDSSPESIENFKGKDVIVHTPKKVHWADGYKSTDSDSDANNDSNNEANNDRDTNSELNVKGKGKALYQGSTDGQGNFIDDKGNRVDNEGNRIDNEGNLIDVTEPNTDISRDITQKPFTFDESNEDSWENTYDDDDKRRYYTALDRLNLTAEQWEENSQNRAEYKDSINREIAGLKRQEEIDNSVAKSLEEENKSVAKEMAESIKNWNDKALAMGIDESLNQEDKQMEESTSNTESNKRKLDTNQEDYDLAKKMQKYFDETDSSCGAGPSSAASSSRAVPSGEDSSPGEVGPHSGTVHSSVVEPVNSDNESDYSVLSSMRGDESPNTYYRKLQVQEIEFNLETKKKK